MCLSVLCQPQFSMLLLLVGKYFLDSHFLALLEQIKVNFLHTSALSYSHCSLQFIIWSDDRHFAQALNAVNDDSLENTDTSSLDKDTNTVVCNLNKIQGFITEISPYLVIWFTNWIFIGITVWLPGGCLS